MALSFNDVNRKGSFTWVKMNDDAQSNYFRNVFLQKHGGQFVKNGRTWEWQPRPEEIIILDPAISRPANPIKEEPKEPVKTWIFHDKDGNVVKTQNIQEFCKEHQLTRSSLYEVISGKRKHHKGFVFVETTME